jgi:hypothetical protein
MEEEHITCRNVIISSKLKIYNDLAAILQKIVHSIVLQTNYSIVDKRGL